MISILTVKDAEKLNALYKEAAQTVTCVSGAVEAVDTNTDEVLGYCLYEIDSEKITISTINSAGDVMLADGLLRSALHVALTRNIGQAFYNDFAPFMILKQLKFIGDEANRTLKIEKLTECGCE